jgi:hypothetical protein
MSKTQVLGPQKIVFNKITQKEATSGKTETGTAWQKPPHQLLVGIAKLTELVDKAPASFDKPIAIVCADLTAKFEIGVPYEVVVYSEAKGKAGEKNEYHLVSFAPASAAKKASL